MTKTSVLLFIILMGAMGFKTAHRTTPYPFPNMPLFPEMPYADHNPVTVEGVDLGRHLFYDSILSLDNNLSCGSCHRQEAAFCDGPKDFSTGAGGVLLHRNTLPLFNLAWAASFFWDGRAATIEEQVFHPVSAHDEMNLSWTVAAERVNSSEFYKTKFKAAFGDQPIDSSLIAKAIGQFERTLLSYSSKYDRVLAGKDFFTKEEFEGFELANDMTKGDCLHCHPTDGDALGTTFHFSENGLDNVQSSDLYNDRGRGAITGNANDNGKFKIPSLRNLLFTAPYMHDGRFKTLEEVLDFYSTGVHAAANTDSKMTAAHKGGVHLSDEDKKKILAFLKTLTDSSFTSNPAYSNPFRK